MANVNKAPREHPVEYIAMFDNGGRRDENGKVTYPAAAGEPSNKHHAGSDVFNCDSDY